MSLSSGIRPVPHAAPSRGWVIADVERDAYDLIRRDLDASGQRLRSWFDNGRMEFDQPATSELLLDGITWQTYDHLVRALEEHHLRLTYDQGRLSIVSPSPRHDKVKHLVGSFVGILAVELRIPISSFGSTTWRYQGLAKGLEPDECFYVQTEPLVRGRDDIDLAAGDPPPDLAVEVEVSTSSVPRHPIYAALGVKELWLIRDDRIRAVRLHGSEYLPIDRSLAFPMLRPSDLEPFLKMRRSIDETTLRVRVAEWVRSLAR